MTQEAANTEIENTEISTDLIENVDENDDFEIVPELSPEPKKAEQKSGFVKTDDPKVQARIDYLYKAQKEANERNEALWQMLQKMDERFEKAEKQEQKQLVSEAEKVLKQRLKEAKENEDIDQEINILRELTALADKKEPEDKPEKPEKLKKEAPYDDEVVQYVAVLAEEKDENGNMLRPWMRGDHPLHKVAVALGSKLEAKYTNPVTGQVDDYHGAFEELDQLMEKYTSKQTKAPQTAPSRNAPDPLASSNLTSGGTREKMKITEQQAAMAKKLGLDLSNEKVRKAYFANVKKGG